MRFLFILFLATPLAGFAMTLDTSKDAPSAQDVCTSAHCEQGNPPSAIESRTPQKSGAEDNAPFADTDGPVEAKGGGHGGGGHGGGRGGSGKKGGGGVVVVSSGNSKAGANPLSVLQGPILLLNSILPTARAQTSLGKSPAAAGGSGFVGKTA
ncbi:hypothetical protein GJ744_010356 [Endocarpon pusillum]|uniref:Uncharacterized protein n=1 Tax=Endocarpon pusillum TaxID=364733 RepID=A0A8H7E3R4_9EURO|nr:hypothetical protein GJ744_010356 [Endocarpon pusillum]